MITLLNTRRFFVEAKNWPEERGLYISVDGDKVFELHIVPMGQNQIQCTSERLEKTPFRTSWIKIPISAIATIERVDESSFIWQSVYKAKTNIVLPGTPNVQDIGGRQKFGKVK
jgi:hypothetical protein